MKTEDICIKNIEAAIRGIKMGTKKPEDVGGIVNSNLTMLKPLNEGMYDDLLGKYKNVVEANKKVK